MQPEDPRDILITNITREYGNAQKTREMLKIELFKVFRERGYSDVYGPVENIRIPFDGIFHKYYYAHMSMRNVDTHPALLEEIRRSTIMFGSDELLFSNNGVVPVFLVWRG